MKRPVPAQPIDAKVMRRLDVLEWLIDSEYEGKPKTFESSTGIKMAQVSQWFSGYRALRDKALNRLEERTGKPPGWFDEAKATANLTMPGFSLEATGGSSTGDYGSKQHPALVDTAPVATNVIAEKPLSPYARTIGLMFDSLPDDAHIRTRVMGEITAAILAAKRPPKNQPQTEPTPVRIPKRQFS